ncbi:MAG TPA: exo-alpha-sialidase, partial [Ignavibacteriales bacterium]|nr:exo-alpha-sialidase [Ignavibacteriales bacterium]
MKTKIILFLLLIAISIPYYIPAQIPEVEHLPVQNQSQAIKESVPVWLSDNDIMIFYVNQTQDTIFSTKSNDEGVTWQQPSVVITIDSLEEGQVQIYPTAIRTETGRILLAWSVLGEGINLIYSDDFGNTWSDVQIILGSGTVPALRKNLSNPKLSKLNNNRLLLNFNSGANNPQSILYYRISNDNGLTWGDTVYSIKRNGLYYFEDQ